MTRFRALHEYTSRLPLRSLSEDAVLIAGDSNQAVESGVVNGIVYEIEGYVARLSEEYDDLKIIFTGGDSNFFAKRLKNTIFATYDLVAFGLNRILEHNAK
jgi:type III pantothenate kinase